MKVQHGKDLASHSGPESCGGAREGAAEALTGETGGSAIEPRNAKSGTPTPLSDAEGNMNHGDKCESWGSPARSETSGEKEAGGDMGGCIEPVGPAPGVLSCHQ